MSSLDPLLMDDTSSKIPVLEIIKVFGTMAGPDCYGKLAPQGASCQITLNDIERIFQLENETNQQSPQSTRTLLTLEEFQSDLKMASFQWPLKPYGIDKSLSKTAIMNKGAETRVFMEELETRGLYDKRNPTGPLPTSLRPQLNTMLQQEGIDDSTSEKIFQALGGTRGTLSVDKLREMVFTKPMDYYDFVEKIGKDTISWPY